MSEEELGQEDGHIEEKLVVLSESEEKPKKKRGRPKAAKSAYDEAIDRELLDLVKNLSERLADAEKRIADKPPASVRLETSRKGPKKIPEWTGVVTRVKFQRNDQPDNPMTIKLRNHLIDWCGELIPGREYDLPEPVISFINSRKEPKYQEVQDPDNPRQTLTKIVGEKQRCYCIPVGI